eukprot:TRINITY_DN514_c0_g1_i1.p1 TRINITY_DN514_c0_g1~~TRINITY_DN514_c0_g1_i1.p1  ORF type:complete len:635 (+),score=111.64 TRINITY_DN514_c0_g1_i1:168-2072(+)
MTSVLKSLKSFFVRFGAADKRGLFLGLDGSGRTTCLYRLILSSRVETIPTIGFNIETIKWDNLSLTAWDIGGCDKIRALWRHYFQGSQVVVFFVDSRARHRVPEVKDHLEQLMLEDELRGIPVLVLCTKQDEDLGKSMRDDEKKAVMNRATAVDLTRELDLPHTLRGRPWLAVGCSLAIEGEYLKETYAGFEWLRHVMCSEGDKQEEISKQWATKIGAHPIGGGYVRSLRATPAELRALTLDYMPLTDLSINAPSALGDLEVMVADETQKRAGHVQKGKDPIVLQLEDWLKREDEDEGDDAFLERFYRYDLESWDHYTHLRIGYLLLTRYGRREGIKRIFEGIKDYIENSGKTNKTYHETMTYFWAHMIHFAIITTQNNLQAMAHPRTSDGGRVVEEINFKTVLLLNPHLANGGLFLEYYTKELMLMRAESRQSFFLPDVKPLPSMIPLPSTKLDPLWQSQVSDSASVVGKNKRSAANASAQRNTQGRSDQDDGDDLFLAAFTGKGGELSSWGHLVMLRAIWLLLSRLGRREALVAIHDGFRRIQGEGYHTTLSCFWVTMVTRALAQMKNVKKDGTGEVVAMGGGTRFVVFLEKYPKLKDSDHWKKYYAEKTLFSPQAKEQLVLPDLKSFTSVV